MTILPPLAQRKNANIAPLLTRSAVLTRSRPLLRHCAAALALGLVSAGTAAETITVSAAASLGDAFKAIAREYEAQHPEDNVLLNVGGSGTLLQQIRQGAPVDVFASADEATMDKADEAGLIAPDSRHIFARNTLVLIQPANAHDRLNSLEALTADGVRRIAMGNPDSVPAGRYTRRALEAAGVWEALQPRMILTQNVRQALDYVARGEVGAGFVYGSDVARRLDPMLPNPTLPGSPVAGSTLRDATRPDTTPQSDAVTVAFTVPLDTPVKYPIALVGEADSKPAASRFLDLVLSPKGQSLLMHYGFEGAATRPDDIKGSHAP